MKKPVLYVITNNHFDPTWRRCWNRRLQFKGLSFVSYAELQDYYMTDNLAMARRHPEYKFDAESTIVLRQYVKRHPGRLKELRALAAKGRFAVAGAGDNVIDSNMVLGESLVRNFVTGLLWVEDNLGTRTRMGVRNDAFGNSAQLPQILRGCEIPWATGLFYTPIQGRFWRGLDGSVVCTAEIPTVVWGGGCDKYPPCPECDGKGCKACDGRGIDLALRSRLPGEIDAAKLAECGCGRVHMGPEELLPNPEIFAWARKMRRRYDVRFATIEQTRPCVQKWIDQVDAPPEAELHPSAEANPNNSGVWVTRIKLKQRCRREEYALLEAETLSSLAALAGAKYPRKGLAAIWQRLHFTMFHDAITATHVDAAYEELLDTQTGIVRETGKVRTQALRKLVRRRSGVVSVLNTTGGTVTAVGTAFLTSSCGARVTGPDGKPADVVDVTSLTQGRLAVEFIARDVPPMSARSYRVTPSPAMPRGTRLGKPVIENERFRVVADERGIVAIFDKRLSRDIVAAGQYRPNEMVLERDEGSPWATLSPDRPRTPLAPSTTLVQAEKAPAYQRLTFKVTTPNPRITQGFGFECTTSVALYRGIERVSFWTNAKWDAYNFRVRVAMPVPSGGKGVYGIPYGMIERGPYKPEFDWWTANGDWPAVNWAGVQSPEASVALLNQGIPSYGIEDDPGGGKVMLLSILRSPAVPTYLHEPSYYSMTDYDGMRDAGGHQFKYALTAYDSPFAESSIVNDAEGYNAGLLTVEGEVKLPEAPRVESDHVRISALKWAEQGEAIIVRLWEYRGRSGVAEVAVPAKIRAAAKVNLLERQAQPLAIENSRVKVPVRGWEIATLRLEV